MAYVQKAWVDGSGGGTPIVAADLNRMEAGINAALSTVVMQGAGIDATGAADSTTAIQALLDSLPTTGGSVYFPPGIYKFTGLIITRPTTVTGAGSGDTSNLNAVTQLQCTSATGIGIDVRAHACLFQDFLLYNTNTAPVATAGAGIAVTVNGNACRFDRIDVSNFWIDIDYRTGGEWWLTNSTLRMAVQYGIKIANAAAPDGGDWTIEGVQFKPGGGNVALAAIRQESAGGGKIRDCKVNGATTGGYTFAYGYDIANSAAATAIVLFDNNSVENVRVNGVRVVVSGTGSQPMMIFSNSQFGLYFATGSALDITNVDQLILTGLHLRGASAAGIPAINLTTCTNVRIRACTHKFYTQLATAATSSDIIATGVLARPVAGDNTADKSTTSTTYVAMGGIAQAPIAANVGDRIKLQLTASIYCGTVAARADLTIGVGATPIALTNYGVTRGTFAGVNYLTPMVCARTYDVVAADIVSGLVTFTAMWKTPDATTINVANSTGFTPFLSVENLGPQI